MASKKNKLANELFDAVQQAASASASGPTADAKTQLENFFALLFEASVSSAVVTDSDTDGVILTLDRPAVVVAADFTVTVAGSEATISSVAGSGSQTITITLSAAVTNGQVVTVDHTPSETSELEALSAQAVTNSVS